MTRTPNTLTLTLSWLQVVAIALSIGGSIVYACVEIRIAVREIQAIGQRLVAHEDRHESLERDSERVHTRFERRLSRIEGRLPVNGGGQ